MSKIPPTEYDRAVAISRVTEILKRWFHPGPAARIADLVDVLELVLKQLLPGYHVRLSIEKITGGETVRGAAPATPAGVHDAPQTPATVAVPRGS